MDYLPVQLQDPSFRFIILGKQGTMEGKRPMEKEWSRENNYPWNHPMIQAAVDLGHNIGILGGPGRLLIIDFDDEDYQNNIKLPDTFTVKSGGRGLHHKYFLLDEVFSKFPIKEDCGNLPIIEKPKTMADMQCSGGYIVAPWSVHDSGRTYDIWLDVPIQSLTCQELKNAFGKDWHEEQDKLPYIEEDEPTDDPWKREVRLLKSTIKISTLLSHFGKVKVYNHTRCSCPVHPVSKGNLYNLDFSDDIGLWYCFDANVGGDIFSLVQHYYNCDFKEAKVKLLNLLNTNVL